MKNFLPFGIIAACFLISCHNSENKEQDLPQLLSTGKFIDLSYDFSAQTLYWPNNPTGFVVDTLFEGTTTGGFYYSSYSFCAPEHGGTHLDAPVHSAAHKETIDQLSID